MKIIFINSFYLISIFFSSINNLNADHLFETETKTFSAEVIKDKIRGGLLGQILGNLNGLPHENMYINEPGNVNNYIPWLPDGAITDDDTDFEWVYIYEMQKSRNALLSEQDITELWKGRINARIWSSNRFVRHLMDIGIEPPYTGYSIFNPWAEFNVSGQFLCETFGLLAPGMPQTASRIGLNYTTVAINNEPAQTTQLFTSMIATAFVENDINKILDAGVASLDQKSIVIQIINDVKKWHKMYPDCWQETRRLLRDKYTQEEGRMRDRNGYELNTGSIIAALLYGNGDFAESVKLAFNFGWDADCNAATVGTIIGVTYGYRKMLNHNMKNGPQWQIVDRYKNTTRDNMPVDETITSFADRVIELFEMINEKNGGSKTVENKTTVYKIPIEQSIPVIGLASTEERKNQMLMKFGEQIRKDLMKGTREERARAAYLAICLDMKDEFANNNTKQWKESCNLLSGYWKIMNNIFFGDFQGLELLRKKFESAGFKVPDHRPDDNEVYNDSVIWRDPKSEANNF